MKFINKGRKIDMECGDRLRYYREEILDMTRVSFGEMVGLTENFIYKLESGRKDLTLKTAAKIASKADIDFIWLVTGLEL